MKSLFRIVLGFLAITFLGVQCNDDDSSSEQSSINYNNQTYSLNKGILENYGNIRGTGYNLDLTLLSSGLVVHVTDNMIDSISGTGNGINFELFSTNQSALNVGDYTYYADSKGNPGTFYFGKVILNFNIATETGINLDLTGGIVSVTRSGTEYELTFNCTASDGKAVTGYYRGPLTYYNYASNNTLSKSATIKHGKWWMRK